MKRVNPFCPNSPVNPAMFIGRIPEINKLKVSLIQARSERPTHFIITGERGIGKSSLSLYLRHVAQGHVELFDERVNFLVLDIGISKTTTQLGLLKRIQAELTRQLAQSETARQFMSDAWSFLTRVQVGGFKIEEKVHVVEDELLFDEFVHSLSVTMNRVCSTNGAQMFGQRYDGILLLIDEADNASPSLDLGSLMKHLLESLQKKACNKLLVGLVGLPEVKDVLVRSHESSLRLFEEHMLDRLAGPEVEAVIDTCLSAANTENPRQTVIEPSAKKLLVELSERYPHFIQQFGYCAMAEDQDGRIDCIDVLHGAGGTRGALEMIGERYYRTDFYTRIQTESYRQVLRIMAEDLDGWVTRSDIKAKYHGKETTLNNALKALRDRHIIIPKEGESGVYRLQHKGFAMWIKLYTGEGLKELTEI